MNDNLTMVATVSEQAIMKTFKKGIAAGIFVTAVVFGTGIGIGKNMEKRRILKDFKNKGEFSINI